MEQEDDVSDFQRGFEAGLTLGLRTADVLLREGGGRVELKRHIDEMEDVKRRRARDRQGIPEMRHSDIFLARPLMVAADIYGAEELAQLRSDVGVAAESATKHAQDRYQRSQRIVEAGIA
jgi:hypothetical protein